MKSKSRAKVTKIRPPPPIEYYKVECNLDEEDALHLANWLRYIKSRDDGLRCGLRDLLIALEFHSL